VVNECRRLVKIGDKFFHVNNNYPHCLQGNHYRVRRFLSMVFNFKINGVKLIKNKINMQVFFTINAKKNRKNKNLGSNLKTE